MNLTVEDMNKNFEPRAFSGVIVWSEGKKSIVCRRDDTNSRAFTVFNEYGSYTNKAGHEVPMVAEVSVDADKTYGSKDFKVEINWSAWGAQPVSAAAAFTETMQLAIEFGKVLESWCLLEKYVREAVMMAMGTTGEQ
jgi:hypothetical protein